MVKPGTFAPGYVARRPTLSPHQLRQAWVAAVELAAGVTRAAQRHPDDDASAAAAGDLARLMTKLRDLKAENFPSPAWSARIMAGAFLHLAQAFVSPNMGPEARTACAAFLGEGAAVLDRLLTELRTEEARASWRGQTGERDD